VVFATGWRRYGSFLYSDVLLQDHLQKGICLTIASTTLPGLSYLLCDCSVGSEEGRSAV
jgi:hypothetical protein